MHLKRLSQLTSLSAVQQYLEHIPKDEDTPIEVQFILLASSDISWAVEFLRMPATNYIQLSEPQVFDKEDLHAAISYLGDIPDFALRKFSKNQSSDFVQVSFFYSPTIKCINRRSHSTQSSIC